jgi:hypothetical protein
MMPELGCWCGLPIAGGNAIIAPHVHKFCGIRNGIDQDLWDPENNMWLPMPITPENVVEVRREGQCRQGGRDIGCGDCPPFLSTAQPVVTATFNPGTYPGPDPCRPRLLPRLSCASV